MSETTPNGRKRLITILVAAIAALALILGACIFFALQSARPEPTEPTEATEPERTGVWHCICGSQTDQHLEGCNGTEVQWTPWRSIDALPTSSGKYYLTSDVYLDTTSEIYSAGAIYLDLNGHTITTDVRAYLCRAANTDLLLTLLDSKGGGKMVATEKMIGNGMLATIILEGNKNVTVYGGTYDASAAKPEKAGGILTAHTKGNVINIHGGKFIGGNNPLKGGTISIDYATVNITGGEICGGSAINGGNIWNCGGIINMTGGEIHGGTAINGGNIAVVANGEVTISGGKVYGGNAKNGGNIFNELCRVRVSGTGEVFDGVASIVGHNVFNVDGVGYVNNGKVYLTENGKEGVYPIPVGKPDKNHRVCICGSKTDSHKPGCKGIKYSWIPWTESDSLPTTSGKYYLACDVKVSATHSVSGNADIYLDLNGHKITTDVRVYLSVAEKADFKLTMLDSVGGGKMVATKKMTGNGMLGTIILEGNKSITVYGGTYDASKVVSEKNGSILTAHTEGCTINIHGGKFIGGKTTAFGGVIAVDYGTLNITGGEIYGGTADRGGNIHITEGIMNMSGGKIYGGNARIGGNVLAMPNSKVNITGGQIYNGTASDRGGNIFNNKSSFKISGSAKVYDGVSTGKGPNIFNVDGSELVNKGKVYLTGSNSLGIYPVPPAEPDENHKVCICGSSTSEHKPGCDGTKYAWIPWTDDTTLPAVSGKYYLAGDVTLATTVTVPGKAEIYLDLNGHTITTDVRAYLSVDVNVDFALTMLDSVGGGKLVATEKMVGNGLLGTIIVEGEKSITVYGGTYDASKVVSAKSGGIITAHNVDCTVNIHGGKFIGAKTSAYGGVIAIDYATLNITGGEICGGTADRGGSIHISEGIMNMSGGKIYGGNARLGGNIFASPNSQMNITGGQIYNGTASDRGGNIFNNKGSLKISGTAKVYDGVSTGVGANIFNVDGSEFVNDGNVYITDSSATGIYPEVIEVPDETVMGCICGSNSDNPAEHKPGCDGTKHEWTYWTSADKLPATPGKYILYNGVNLSVQTDITTSGDIYLNLNGQTVTSNGSARIYNISTANITASLTILDSVGSGLIDLGNYTGSGSLILLNAGTNHKFTMYGGTVDGSETYVANHGAVVRNIGHTVEIHGGTIIAGESYSGDKSGGAIHSTGTVVMTGGEIYGGKGVNGGNISIAAGSFTLNGGKIYNGVASALGHNIFVADGATFTYDPDGDAEVYLTGSESSGIHPDPNPVVRTSCICGSNSDNVADHKTGCDGTKYDDWQAWTSTTALPNTSGRYYLTADVTVSATTTVAQANAAIYLDLNGFDIIADTTNSKDFRVYHLASDYDASLTISDSVGDSVIDLNDLDYAACLVILYKANKVFTMYGGTVDGSDVLAENHGGLIRVIGQTANIHGGTLIGGSCYSGIDAGIVNVSSDGVLNITGGTLKGGRADNGGNIRIEQGTLNMTGGEVLDGVCKFNGANIWIGESSLSNVTIAPEATVGFTDPAKTYTGIYPTEVTSEYKVVHKLQNVDNDEYGQDIIVELLRGMAGFSTEASALTDTRVNGFTAKIFEQATIAADGTTEVVIYYDRNSYNVTWLAQDGTTVLASGPVKFGAALTAPEAPAIADYLFTGWTPSAPATMPAEDVTFTAQYIYNKLVNVYFNSNGGSAVAPQKVAENTAAIQPTDPTKLYATFAGWYTDAELTTAWSFETPVTAEITLYAKWADAVTWNEWTDGTKLPNTTGNYKLMVPVSVSALTTLSQETEIVIDLNGQTVTSTSSTGVYTLNPAAGVNVKLSIWDSTTEGKINLTNGRFAEVRGGGNSTLNIQGGTINGATYTPADNGGVLRVAGANNHINVSGGVIKGASISASGTHGGICGIDYNGNFTVSGGVLYGGNAVNGGNFHLDNSGKLTITGGEIYGGSANNGGNIFLQGYGKVVISGGKIHGGTASSRGGNIFVSTNGTCVVNGTAEIFDGTANGTDVNQNKSGNVWVVAAANGFFSSTGPNVNYDPSVSTNIYMTADPENSGIFRAS